MKRGKIKQNNERVTLSEFSGWICEIVETEQDKAKLYNSRADSKTDKGSPTSNNQRNQQNQRANNVRNNNYQGRSWENSRPPAHQYNQNRPTAPFQQKMSDGRAVNNVRFADDNHTHQRPNNQRYHNPQKTLDHSAIHVAEIHHDNNWQPEQNETTQAINHVSVGSGRKSNQTRTRNWQRENRKFGLPETKQEELAQANEKTVDLEAKLEKVSARLNEMEPLGSWPSVIDPIHISEKSINFITATVNARNKHLESQPHILRNPTHT